MHPKPKRAPAPALIVAIIALVAALTGSAVALPGKNSVQSNDIKKNAIRSKHVKNDSLKGVDIKESTLAQVPSAASADSATDVGYQKPFNLRLSFGQDVEIASNGSVSLRARCVKDGELDGNSNQDGIAIYAKTTAAQSFLSGYNLDYEGDTDGDGPEAYEYLEPTTPAGYAELSALDIATGGTEQVVTTVIDHGWVAGPDGKYVGVDGESSLLALRAFGVDCAAIGVAYTIG